MEQKEVVLAPELNYNQSTMLSPSYQYLQVTAAESLQNFPVNAAQTVTFLLTGNNVYNLAKSYIQFVINVPSQTAGRYAWINAVPAAFFRSLSWGPNSQSSVIYIDQAHHYSKLMTALTLSKDEADTNDNSNLVFTSENAPSQNITNLGFNAAANNSQLKQCINVNDGTNNACNYQVKIPLRLLAPHTLLALDKDLCLGTGSQLQLVLEEVSKVFWCSTDSQNPATGVTAINPTNVTYNSFYLQLAVEQNELINNKVKQMAMSGYSMDIPHVHKVFQQSISGTTQNILSPVINSSYGKKLVRIITAPFTDGANNQYLDNSNQLTATVTDAAAQNRVTTIQCLFNNRVRQQKYIQCSPCAQKVIGPYSATAFGGTDDYDINKAYFQGSSIINSGVLGQNWLYSDDFTDPNNRMVKNLDPELSNAIDGYDLTLAGDNAYQFLANTRNLTNVWYQYVHTIRTLVVSPSGVYIK
jgi:hypothetical protein